ncbi:unnamed protein product [Effrenium voratum]|uniref:FYVE-type domain-containing protein n=1 Tax=Effrenium voratum TaxID=2562239 RepID=A0AA36N503_9DINO|nr:unnamed protein product [Effrenium voratum]CAJ1460662.1 unnamed protein product [Effrenium voratum]
MANAVQWIPDDQVSECPLCTQRFGLSKRKHHCRACGRVVCSSCSASRLKINNKEERVCDTCYDLLQHDNGRPVNESFLENKQVEASLKADLREKQQQEEWFRSFLTQVAGAAEDELPQLIANAAARWQSLCRLRGQEDQALQQLKLECLQLEGECREREAALAAGQKIVKALEQELKAKPQLQRECEQLQRTNNSLQQELAGLQQRSHALESQLPSSRTGSFLSVGSSFQSVSRIEGCRRGCGVM